MNNTSSAESASRIAVAANQAASIELPAGAAVGCVAGKLWLTQEGDARDYVVPAGTTFCTDRAGRVVVSAVDAASVVVVRETAPAHCVRGTVRVESVERFSHEARRAQAEYVAGMFVRLAAALVRLFRRRAARPPTAVSGATDAFRGYVRSL